MFSEEAIKVLQQAEAVKAANESVQAAINGKTSIAALPEDFNVHNLEQYQLLRNRPRGVMTTTAIDNFAAYIGAQRVDGATVFISDDIDATAILNLGTVAAPGHADNIAKLAPVKTAAFKALLAIDGVNMNQRQTAEFLEDWTENVTCMNSAEISIGKAIAAVRKLSIEAIRKSESTVQNLSESRSAFESVEASSSDPLPEFVYFKCTPYHGLQERTFVLRFSVLTSSDKPLIVLRIRQLQTHIEEMGNELADKVKAALTASPDVAVVLGKYARS